MAELRTLARPYAKAAFEYAADNGDLQAWSSSLETIAAVTQQNIVGRLLSSPNYTTAEQAKQFIALCCDELNQQTRNFVGVLAKNRRLQLLPQISQQFETLKASREKSVEVEVIVAGEITSEQQEKLTRALSAKLEREVKIQVSVDKSLLGGAIVRAGDTVIDGSIRGRLAKLAETLNS